MGELLAIFARYKEVKPGNQKETKDMACRAKLLTEDKAVARADFYFYQFLSNEYRRSFVEMHFRWCFLIHNDPFFGAPMKQGKLKEPCPYPPGDYHMYNMSIPTAAIPSGFPFTKGRIFGNLTHNGNDVFGGYIDMELKEKRVKN
ncbi:uncharacterized protein LOC133529873 [Cydia pomonella]|uniref:uncharacterized protein LOC133529873 n=1 Tax=Cydia pomonella TaxID=82600 RepID=UPI002ADDB28F|nr:uncharacterized protein LOC133529873 [Cydia pomonella]